MIEPDSEPKDFEREKWRTEVDFRTRELELKTREQSTSEAELEIKRKDQASSTWRNPLTVAIFAAALAAAGNGVVAVVNGSLQRDLEAKKRDAELRLENSKAESGRILEMIKTGDTEKAATNLEFLLKSGLLTDSALVQKLSEFLKNRQPGSGPSLPSIDSRVNFEQSEPLTPTLQETLQKLLNDYFAYLDQVGFSKPAKTVLVKIEKMEPANAYYADDTVTIDPRLAEDPSVPLREYNHHLLWGHGDTNPQPHQTSAIESGLADYFACSFLNNPKVGEKAAKVYAVKTPYLRILSNERKFGEFVSLEGNQFAYVGAEIWGGAFWEIREKLKRDVADALIAAAWHNVTFSSNKDLQAREFSASVLAQARAKGQKEFADVKAVFNRRGFPIKP